MPDDLDTNGQDGEPLDPNIREELRKARETTRERDELLAKLDTANRENAFSAVGIPTTGAGALFREAYKGPLDPDAVRTAAEGYQVLAPQGQQADSTGMTDEERAALQRLSAAGTGVPPAGVNHMAAYAAEMAAAKSSDEVMAIVYRAQAEHPEIGRFTLDQ